MKVFVAGATGVLGRALVPDLVARGHEVVGMTKSTSKQDLVRSLGAHPVVADALDADAVARAVAAAEPEVIVHQLTALSGKVSARDMRHPDRSPVATMTNRLRVEGTDHLLAAGRAVGARRFVAQSFAAFRFARTGGPVQTEADPLDSNPPAVLRAPLVGILHVERPVTAIESGDGLVLRYGGFYGPGTSVSLAPDAQVAAPIRKRWFPIIGDGGGVWSHIHVDDAAAATAIAVERGEPGIYNIVDDEPAPVREWLPALASALGAKPPRRIPRWLGRLAAGEAATLMMTEARGASNEKGKTRAWLAASLCELATGLRARAGVRHLYPERMARAKSKTRRAPWSSRCRWSGSCAALRCWQARRVRSRESPSRPPVSAPGAQARRLVATLAASGSVDPGERGGLHGDVYSGADLARCF